MCHQFQFSIFLIALLILNAQEINQLLLTHTLLKVDARL